MTLLVDIGNSRVKWASLRDGVLSPAQAMAHHDMPRDELWPLLFAAQPQPQRVVLANVAGDAIAAELEAWSRHAWGVAIEPLRATVSAGSVHNGYADPARLGVDRWLAMIGARADFPTALCVVDCGTALTVDALDAAGVHLGGWIAPGIGLMQGVVQQRAPGVRLELVAEPGVGTFGRDTSSALRSGTCHAGAGLVYQALSLLQSMNGETAQCVVTGGDAAVLLPLLPQGTRHVPDLVLRGMAVVVQQQVPEKRE